MRNLWNRTKKHRPAAPIRPRWNRIRLGLEELENRTLLSTGFTPAQILAAYGFNQLPAANTGKGQTIAIVDAYLQPNIQTDVAAFDAKYGLPAANLTVVNDGATRTDPTRGWALETALDVEWAHAVAPGANIVLVTAANDSVTRTGVPTALLHAVSVAASQPGVNVVSMSWGVNEFPTESQYDSTFNVPGVTFVGASGDSGAPPIWPAVSPYVLAVGGTTLRATSTAGVYTETGWGNGFLSFFFGGSGGGLSRFEAAPSYQVNSDNHYVSSVGSTHRMSPDVSYVADPATGVAVYDKTNGGWLVVGGTSAGTPQWAGLVALADQSGGASLSSTQTLTALYHEQANFYDVTVGNNGYSAGKGYDLVTGLGTPQANLLVPALGKQAAASGISTSDSARAAAGGGSGGGRFFGGLFFVSGNTDTTGTAGDTLAAGTATAITQVQITFIVTSNLNASSRAVAPVVPLTPLTSPVSSGTSVAQNQALVPTPGLASSGSNPAPGISARVESGSTVLPNDDEDEPATPRRRPGSDLPSDSQEWMDVDWTSADESTWLHSVDACFLEEQWAVDAVGAIASAPADLIGLSDPKQLAAAAAILAITLNGCGGERGEERRSRRPRV